MKVSLPEFALKKPVTMVMLSLTVLGLGGIAWLRSPLEFLPRFDGPNIAAQFVYPNGSPQQIEKQVAIPVEGELRTIPGVMQMKTTVTRDFCWVDLYFNLDVDITEAMNELRDRIERLRPALPDAVEHVQLHRINQGSLPVMAIGLYSDEDEEQFSHRVRTLLEPRLSRLAGVADVEIFSPIEERHILIEFDMDRLVSLNLGLTRLITALQQSSLNMTMGRINDSESRYLVRMKGERNGIEDIKSMVVTPNGIRLSDIANVDYKSRTMEVQVGLDGKKGVLLLIRKESEANVVNTCDAVKEEMEKILDEAAFVHVTKETIFDQSDLIMNALRNLFKEGLYGGAMALIVLFIFMHRFRPTIIVALAIPTSLLIALVCMFFADIKLNLITMVSMIIAVGMLVDNSIVVVENIIRHRQLGDDPITSSKLGANEVGLAIFSSTVTTWVVFIPLLFLDAGSMRVIMAQLGFPLVVSLGGSLLIALTIIPLAMSRFKDRKKKSVVSEQKNARKTSFSLLTVGKSIRPIKWIVDSYTHLLSLSLQWRLFAVLILFLMLLITWLIPGKQVGLSPIPNMDTRQVDVSMTLEKNFNMEKSEAYAALVETTIGQWKNELGIENISTICQPRSVKFQLNLVDDALGPYTTKEVENILKKRLPERIPGGELKAMKAQADGGEDTNSIVLHVKGDEINQLEMYANQLRDRLEDNELITEAHLSLGMANRLEMQIQIDERKTTEAGVSPIAIARTVGQALRGENVFYVKQNEREVPVWAQYKEEDRQSKANLDRVGIETMAGTLAPLNRFVDYVEKPAADKIMRWGGKNAISITVKTDTKNMAAVRKTLDETVESMHLPLGYSVDVGHNLKELGQQSANFLATLFLAIALIYIVMAALFESLILPVSIMASVPLSLAGAYWALYFGGDQLDTLTFIGNVLMVGIIVNNGIVIVDHINQLRKKDLTIHEAIVQGGRDRFRPVLMTTITTILGLVPLAMARTGGASMFAGLARALIGGLSAGTLLTLFVVPILYSLLEDFMVWIHRFVRSLRTAALESRDAFKL